MAFLANGQEESPALWGLLTFILCIVGNLLGGLLGVFLGGGATHAHAIENIPIWLTTEESTDNRLAESPLADASPIFRNHE